MFWNARLGFVTLTGLLALVILKYTLSLGDRVNIILVSDVVYVRRPLVKPDETY